MIGIPAEAGDQPFHQGCARRAGRRRAPDPVYRCGTKTSRARCRCASAPSALSPAAIQATKSSREPTGGLGALSSRVDIRRLVPQAWRGSAARWLASARPCYGKDRSCTSLARAAPSAPIAERGIHERESGDRRRIGAQDARAQGDAHGEWLGCDSSRSASSNPPSGPISNASGPGCSAPSAASGSGSSLSSSQKMSRRRCVPAARAPS